MTSTIQLLKNYRKYASEARYHTANLFLQELRREDLMEYNKKLMMLRIIEEFICATEDLAMWLLAVSKRNLNKKFDLVELLLLEEATTQNSKTTLNNFSRARTANGLLKKLDLISLDKLSRQLNRDIEFLDESLDYIFKGIKSTIENRKVKREVLVRAHNKVKHGMMVFLDTKDLKKLWFRDLKVKNGRKTNRYYELEVNITKAEKIVGNIQVISHTIQGLIALVVQDFQYRVENDKRMKAKTKKFWMEELNHEII